eukprot:1060170-Rhodomonas_salina.2
MGWVCSVLYWHRAAWVCGVGQYQWSLSYWRRCHDNDCMSQGAGEAATVAKQIAILKQQVPTLRAVRYWYRLSCYGTACAMSGTGIGYGAMEAQAEAAIGGVR